MVKRRKDKKVSHKEEKEKEGKAIKKVLCKDKVSSLICRAPSLRTGKKTPNFVVPSSIVQDPGIKGALFQEVCCQPFVARNAGLCASPARCTLDDHKTDFSKMGASVEAVTASERKGINGLLAVIESNDTMLEKAGSLQERISAGCGETDSIGKLSATSGSRAGAFNMLVPDDAVGIASDPVEPKTCQFLDKAESAVQGKRQAG